ncbi:MAG TPA: RidA family protein [Alphaproteobacteria bacterium]|nr:RidA family protein [Alphaproteobacteria bacterium]
MKRRSIDIPGFGHKNPIPAASVKGNLVMSGAIGGMDPKTGKLPQSVAEQCANMFGHVRAIMAEEGGSVDDIVKMSIHLRDTKDRAALNEEWKKMFPDEASRPARHVNHSPLPDDGRLIVCEFTAVL